MKGLLKISLLSLFFFALVSSCKTSKNSPSHRGSLPSQEEGLVLNMEKLNAQTLEQH